MPKAEDPFLKDCDDVYARLRGYSIGDQSNRSAFQKEVQKILDENRAVNFYALGEMDYRLDQPPAKPADSKQDWRRRDINRILTRHREDRPIEDARKWAKFALILASLALGSAIVSAIVDLPDALGNIWDYVLKPIWDYVLKPIWHESFVMGLGAHVRFLD